LGAFMSETGVAGMDQGTGGNEAAGNVTSNVPSGVTTAGMRRAQGTRSFTASSSPSGQAR